MKRGRDGGSLTGGTGDVNPQWWNLGSLTQTAPNTFIEKSFDVPVVRVGNKSGRTVVMEMLRVEWLVPVPDANSTTGGNNPRCYAQLTTSSKTNSANNDGDLIAQAGNFNRGAFTAGQSYFVTQENPFREDLTDGQGHGILVATDKVFLGFTTNVFGAPQEVSCRVLYRWKEVGLTEYIGIVQSQQRG